MNKVKKVNRSGERLALLDEAIEIMQTIFREGWNGKTLKLTSDFLEKEKKIGGEIA